jgi:hypothetical protein
MISKTLKEINDSDLDAAVGAVDGHHTDWIPVLSVGQSISRPLEASSGDSDDRPTEEVAFYYNKISSS